MAKIDAIIPVEKFRFKKIQKFKLVSRPMNFWIVFPFLKIVMVFNIFLFLCFYSFFVISLLFFIFEKFGSKRKLYFYFFFLEIFYLPFFLSLGGMVGRRVKGQRLWWVERCILIRTEQVDREGTREQNFGNSSSSKILHSTNDADVTSFFIVHEWSWTRMTRGPIKIQKSRIVYSNSFMYISHKTELF